MLNILAVSVLVTPAFESGETISQQKKSEISGSTSNPSSLELLEQLYFSHKFGHQMWEDPLFASSLHSLCALWPSSSLHIQRNTRLKSASSWVCPGSRSQQSLQPWLVWSTRRPQPSGCNIKTTRHLASRSRLLPS